MSNDEVTITQNEVGALPQAISEMRNMRESYDQIGAAAEAYNTGKTQLAAAITSKGVQAAATETLPELADKVLDIQQTTTVIDGGDMYSAQLTGDGALWDLYQILAQMKSRFMGAGQYACLIVCEYYKGYDSLQLQGADAYYTCDGDFYDTSMPLHVWHDADNGKANRWVCFLYATEGARLDITNTAISPRAMYIGGHIGTIEYFVNGRLTDFVSGVEETDIVDNFLYGGYSQAWGFNCVIRGIKNISNGTTFPSAGVVYVDFYSDNLTVNPSYQGGYINANSSTYVYIEGVKKIHTTSDSRGFIESNNAVLIYTNTIEEFTGYSALLCLMANGGVNLREIHAEKLTKFPYELIYMYAASVPNLIFVSVGGMTTNLKIKNWNPTNVLADATKKAQLIENIKNHILARVSDATGGTQLVFTVSTNMYNKVASEQIEWQGETMSLADAFLTKNWLLAGA